MLGSPHIPRSVRIVVTAITLLVVFAAMCLAANPETWGQRQADLAGQRTVMARSSRLAPSKMQNKELETGTRR